MSTVPIIRYCIPSQLELNLSYMPFIKDGGLFIPTNDSFVLGDFVVVDLQLPGQHDIQRIEGKVIWITPMNALYQIYSGVGIQFTGDSAKSVHEQIKANIDNTMDVGGYVYGIGGEKKYDNKKEPT